MEEDAAVTPPSSDPLPPAASRVVVVGVDVGALTTRLTLGPSHGHELVRDAHGGHAAPTALTFPGPHRARLIGEDASDPSRSDGNTVGAVERLLEGSIAGKDGEGAAGDDPLGEFRRFEVIAGGAGGECRVRIPSTGEEHGATALAAMLLGKAWDNALATVARLDGSDGKEGGTPPPVRLHFSFAVPGSYPQSARDALEDAAHAASVESASTADAAACLAAAYAKKFGDEAEGRVVMIVEVGHARSAVSVIQRDNAEGGSGDMKVLTSVCDPKMGAGLADAALLRHFARSHPKLSSDASAPGSRRAQRLLEGCRKLKHLLSMLPENTVTVENVGKDDCDVNLTASRELLGKLCEECITKRLTGMIGRARGALGDIEGVGGDIDAVEVTGGGTRIPFVQEAIRRALGKGADFPLSRSFDDAALAFGASLVGVPAPPGDGDAEMKDAEREARRAKLLEGELAMAQRDDELRRKDEVRNRIEARVLELRSARHSAHGSLLPSTEEFASFLDDTDQWLFSEECDDATLAQMEAKWVAVRTKVEASCGAYLSAKRKEAEEKEREMEREAALAAAERAAEGGEDGEDDDHDNRKLPFKRRMEIVMKNKNEANELFADGNHRHAAARYAKALSHCAKLRDVDASPEQEAEMRDVKLSLLLNQALAYIKLEKLDNARRCCDDALELDAKSVKALYRRATVLYQRRKFDDAARDLDEAGRLAPEDKAVKKLRKLVDAQVAKQKKKERAMAKKMFG